LPFPSFFVCPLVPHAFLLGYVALALVAFALPCGLGYVTLSLVALLSSSYIAAALPTPVSTTPLVHLLIIIALALGISGRRDTDLVPA
jgi:hypothetical protein